MRHMTGPLPVLIQGGMGAAVSSWQLAAAVARTGQLGVVSGTALDTIVARRLQDGDPGGHIRRALAHLPLPGVADRILARHFKPEGRNGAPYLPVSRLALRSNRTQEELSVAANFTEVWLAKEGHDGKVGINYLEKIQMALPTAAYGAILADVDVVLVGAGIPRELPRLLADLTAHRPGTVHVDVPGSDARPHTFDPAYLYEPAADRPTLHRPAFLAIVSSHVLAQYLTRQPETSPDGFVVEGPSAGGHSAPPRGKLQLEPDGQPRYGPRDDPKLSALVSTGLPFWLAGGYGEPERVREALAAGAAGVQVGTLFALSQESGLAPHLRLQLLDRLRRGDLVVKASATVSPTGFPFKVASLPGTLSEPTTSAARPPLCDLGYLRQPHEREDGTITYRCPAEPEVTYLRKGGTPGERAVCLCNGLVAAVDLGQHRKDGYEEPPVVTLGTDLAGASRLDAAIGDRGRDHGWSAMEVIDWLLGNAVDDGVGSPPDIGSSAEAG
jgi:NAD(P)H-dependent flavin oxidoreductase YrpB (nitropropane dioxygenase family)